MSADIAPRPLPPALRAWRTLGRLAPDDLRWRATRRLTRDLVEPDVLYRNGLGFAFSIDPGDLFQPLMLAGTFDPVIQRVIRERARPSSVVLEAGGHIGFFTLLLGRLVGPAGQVEVFEPEPRLRAALKRHVAANDLPQVQVVAAALSDSSGTATFHLPEQAGWGSLRSEMWEMKDTVEVAVTTIDEHVATRGIDPERISFVKLDVEGLEPEALRGADRTLRAATSAAVLVEFIPDRIRALGGDPDGLVAHMADCGFAHTERVGGEDVLFLRRDA